MHRIDDPAPAGLPAERAFVVQFAGGASGDTLLSGRAEHVNSGQVAHFASLGEFVAFVEGVLGALPCR